MTESEIKINRAIDRLLYPEREKEWDTKCRVCGYRMDLPGLDPCTPEKCESPFYDGYWDGKRADDPQPHTTDHELMARDLERLPEDKRNLFLFELRNITNDPDHQPLSKREWLMLTATLHQKCIAIRRAFGEEAAG